MNNDFITRTKSIGSVNTLSFESMIVQDKAMSLPAIPADAKRAWITVEGGSIRWRTDKKNPKSDEGHIMQAGANFTLLDNNYYDFIRSFKCIKISDDAVVNITYFD